MATSVEIEHLKKVTVDLLKKAYDVHQALGEEGKSNASINAFGETTLKADWEAEEVFVKGCDKAQIPMVISSEEHGEVTVSNDPIYRGVLDGIDGTNAYRMGTGPYGTMFAVFEGVNPRYQDYLVAGILEYPSGRILLGVKNQGAVILEGDRSYQVATSGEMSLNPQIRGYIDGGFEFNQNLFVPKLKDFKDVYLGNIGNKGVPWGVSSMYYFRLATGETDIVLECTRKRNLEIAVAFGILNEAGGSIVDINGNNIGNRRYLDFGQGIGEYLPVISTATKPLADELARKLK
ncbi:MAG: inositol monophosphatase family protein [Patescibacteria group bacterium]